MTYTKQEAFDTVAKHLFEQGRASKRGVYCAYRGEGGTKCAVGVLIPDELYDEEMDNTAYSNPTGIFTVVRKFPELKRIFGRGKASIIPMLGDLQYLHDSAEWGRTNTTSLRAALRRIAKDYRLSPAILETLSFKDR